MSRELKSIAPPEMADITEFINLFIGKPRPPSIECDWLIETPEDEKEQSEEHKIRLAIRAQVLEMRAMAESVVAATRVDKSFELNRTKGQGPIQIISKCITLGVRQELVGNRTATQILITRGWDQIQDWQREREIELITARDQRIEAEKREAAKLKKREQPRDGRPHIRTKPKWTGRPRTPTEDELKQEQEEINLVLAHRQGNHPNRIQAPNAIASSSQQIPPQQAAIASNQPPDPSPASSSTPESSSGASEEFPSPEIIPYHSASDASTESEEVDQSVVSSWPPVDQATWHRNLALLEQNRSTHAVFLADLRAPQNTPEFFRGLQRYYRILNRANLPLPPHD